jgi:hypothetical protein
MPYAPKQDDMWTKVLVVLKWSARLPLAVLAIMTAGLCAWTLFWLIYRAVAWIWERYLASPWR